MKKIKIKCSFCGGYEIESNKYKETSPLAFFNCSQDDNIEFDLCVRCMKKGIEKLLS